jgi:hypothetical protein
MIINLLKILLVSSFVLMFSVPASATESKRTDLVEALVNQYESRMITSGLDSVPRIKHAGDKKQEGKKPDIKEVPKSRRQLKPSAVKGRVKGKPVKIPKPKVIKKNIGRGLKLLK